MKVLRIILSIVFLLSSVLKAVNINSFALETRLYLDAYFWDLKSLISSLGASFRIDMFGAIGVCMIEMLVALLAIRNRYIKVAGIGFCVMLSFFVYLTGLNLFFPTIMGSIESCGCFGELIHFSPLTSFVKSVVLWGMSVGCWVVGVRCWRMMSLKSILQDGKMYITLVLGALPPFYSYFCFENMEHGWYIVGYITLCILVMVALGFCYVNRK